MIEKYGYYEFEIFESIDEDFPNDKTYRYKIYIDDEGYLHGVRQRLTIRESPSVYGTVHHARYGAIFEIDLLQHGEVS